MGDTTAGAVAADGDDGLCADVDGLSGESFLVSGCGGLVDGRDAARGERGANRWNPGAYSAAPGGWVNDEAGDGQVSSSRVGAIGRIGSVLTSFWVSRQINAGQEKKERAGG